MAGQNLALKVVVTPLLIGGASLAGRRFGHHVLGLLAPAVFFLVLALTLPAVGLLAFAIAAAAALAAQAVSMLAIPRDRQPAVP